MSEAVVPELDSIWESKDKRDNGRRVKVVNIRVDGTYLDVRRVTRGDESHIGRVNTHQTSVFVKRWRKVT